MAHRRRALEGLGGLSTPLHEVALLRLVAQRVAGARCAGAVEAVRLLTAVQAQDLPGALTSVALRTRRRSRADVEQALAHGEVVRSWPMRGTLHLVVAQDLHWMLELLAPRVVDGRRLRWTQLGLTDDAAERAREVAVQALAGRQLTRAELMESWEQGGVDTGGQRGYHLIGHLAMTGTLCLGPLRGKEQLLVLLDEWVPRPRVLDREAALAEVAERYFRSHGPATLQDLARWTGLKVVDARAGLEAARPRLATLDLGGVEHLMDPGTPELLAACRHEARGVHLLPGFDEIVLGYGDRSAVLAPEHADRIVPGGNGVFRPTVVSDGRIVATWSRGRRKGMAAVVQPFDDLAPGVAETAEGLVEELP